MSIRERIYKLFNRKEWEENNKSVSRPLTAAELVKENMRVYHAETLTKLYINYNN